MFAVSVRKRLKEMVGVSLNLRGFLFGNILPDISRKYGRYPHYMKDALPHVIKSKDKLINKNTQAYSSYQFAKELGAINHYLSDFFCHPHTSEFQGSKAEHGIYEFAMIIRYRKGIKEFNRMLKEQNILLQPSDIRTFIEENKKKYKNKNVSDINDIKFALFVGTKLGESMIVYQQATSL